ncbi:protein SAWADEE HOMEODOMAIN HOMOLOG 2-like isoform X2 [Castanea sativa]|uniref:protein SAWADEE HOMEODOMAIN HOMOLOG 2-like isoform X2 n=1 Tax=Castanea sativa TaxID=21020 RepID=UPI003F6541A1
MDRLRPRERPAFSGFTKAEIEKMEKLLKESGEQLLNREICQRIAKSFNRSSGRAGKPIVKWNEVHSWFQNQQQNVPEASKNVPMLTKASPSNGTDENLEMPKDSSKAGERIPDSLEAGKLEFEARSSKDGAWYDVDVFLDHRFLSGEFEVCVRFIGFGAEEDEWVNVKKSVRQRSIPLEHSECHKVKVGDLVLCFQEKRDQAIYYDAHVLEIQRRLHDIRGCRCLFLLRYDHDDSEERVRLRRLCRVLR